MITRPKKRLFNFYKTIPTQDFVVNKLLPIYNIYGLKDSSFIKYNNKEAEEELIKIINDLTYHKFFKKKILEKNIKPITVLKQHLLAINWSLIISDRMIHNHHSKEYRLIDLSKPDYEIKNNNQLITFD
jgi:hypothetical protein